MDCDVFTTTTFPSIALSHENVDMNELWYTTREIVEMGQRTGALVRHVADQEEDAWSLSLERLYDDICSDENRDDDSRLRSTAMQESLDECTIVERLGIEGGAVPSIGRDAALRRKQMQQVVAEYQQAPISDHDMRQALIRQGSRDISRPARVFARHVAVRAAEASALPTATN